ncbi:hypothetical protein LCGC14_1322060 [marine sediment metagenome]|uniref:Prohead serine protease domain-containing protein n=1 Tax=marine sediment metagenome TaxID=412755 RepID=A0A0F9KJ73_9ZZZZ
MDAFIRSVDFRMVENSDGQTLEGYAAVFDSPTVINGWEGHFVEVIERGAFARTVRDNPKPVMQFDHGTHPMVGGLPIGTIQELREDDEGLFVRAKLHDNWLIEPVRDAIREGSLTGMSFKFTIPEGGVTVTRGEDDIEIHTLTDLNFHELGPVVWPAYKETSVGVRSRELADILTNDAEARTVVAAALYGTKINGDTEVTVDPSDVDPTVADTDTDLAVRSDDEPTATNEPDSDEESEGSDEAVRSDDESDVPTGSTPDEPTADEESDVRSDDEPVRSDDDYAKPTVHPARQAHRLRLAQIMAARTARAVRQLEAEDLRKHGKRIEFEKDDGTDGGSERQS